jgi:uncharacterized SAM-binding protein YcdF (DUF218 family)
LPIVANNLVKYHEFININAASECFDEQQKKVLVILSGGINNNENQFLLSKLQYSSYVRVLSAYQIYQNNRSIISNIVVAGGVGHDIKEADVMKTLLISLGVEPEIIHIDRDSMNTYQNAVNVARIITSLGSGVLHSDIILVTSALHMKRALLAFDFMGISACPYSVNTVYVSNFSFLPRLSALDKSTRVIQEILSYWFYISAYKK